MSNTFDFCIMGAGLAGVSLAHELLSEQASVFLVDPRGIAGGASGAPLALVNPATGRYATKTSDAEECINSVKTHLEMVQESSPVQFFKQTGVLRPALDSRIASRMQQNLEETQWPDGWIEWMDEQTLKEFHPGINCVDGGVWLPVGMTVDSGVYLSSFKDRLVQQGLKLNTGSTYKIKKKENSWQISFENGQSITAANLIFTTGIYSSEFKFWKDIKLHPVKGQLAVMEAPKPVNFNHAVSALGYTSSLSSNRFLIGSTYEHEFEDEEPDAEGLDYLLSRFGKVLPSLRSESKVIAQWAGVRASTPNRKPVIGRHPEHENLYLFAGLGSKGLLYSAYGSQLLARNILSGSAIPQELDIQRFYS
jgi:glycine/D-amino acid oxidase-like deaminating enzyme